MQLCFSPRTRRLVHLAAVSLCATVAVVWTGAGLLWGSWERACSPHSSLPEARLPLSVVVFVYTILSAAVFAFAISFTIFLGVCLARLRAKMRRRVLEHNILSIGPTVAGL